MLEMKSVIQHGRRRGSSKSAEAGRTFQAPDLRQVKVLSKPEWGRIQDELNQVNKDKERVREAVRRREALHLQSKEVVKLWSNTIAGQRQKKLEAKKVREQAEEEKRKLIDIEEAKYQQQQRKEAIQKAKTQLYYQTDRVKELHSALLLTEVLKEREAQLELKQIRRSASKDVEEEFRIMAKSKEGEALRKEREEAADKRRERKAVAEDLKNQMKETELARERQKTEDKKDGEDVLRLQALYRWEQRMEEERQAELKRKLMQAHLGHVSDRDHMRAADAQKREAEEEQRKLYLSTKQKIMKMRKEKETELFREAQTHKERIMNKLAAAQQEQVDGEDQRIAAAVSERDAREEAQRREDEEQRAAMLEAIAAHRQLMRQEKEQRDKDEHRNARDVLEAKKEADRIFSENQQLKAQRHREDLRKLQDFNATQTATRIARQQQRRREELGFEAENREVAAVEQNQFRLYAGQVIDAAADAQRNVIPLCKAARDGMGGGLGPVFSGVRPSYLVQDRSGAQMPSYVSGVTQEIKRLNEVEDIQEAKRRLGFLWG